MGAEPGSGRAGSLPRRVHSTGALRRYRTFARFARYQAFAPVKPLASVMNTIFTSNQNDQLTM